MHREVLGFMDKVIIVGTYEFIGFQLCLSLLEQGSRSDWYSFE